MSRAGVGMVIEKLVTDENLRIRFALDRMETSPSCFAWFRSQCGRDRPVLCDGCCSVVPG